MKYFICPTTGNKLATSNPNAKHSEDMVEVSALEFAEFEPEEHELPQKNKSFALKAKVKVARQPAPVPEREEEKKAK